MRMQNAVLIALGVAFLVSSGALLFKLSPRDGEPGPAWMESDGAGTAVALGLMMMGTLGVALLIKALVN
jgi:hypothetical protein